MMNHSRELVLLSVLAFLWAVVSQVESRIPAEISAQQLARRQMMSRRAVRPKQGSAPLPGSSLQHGSMKEPSASSMPVSSATHAVHPATGTSH